jgi:hypothetical protein
LSRIGAGMIGATCERFVANGPDGPTHTDWPAASFGLALRLGAALDASSHTQPDVRWQRGFISWSDPAASGALVKVFGLHVASEKIADLAERLGSRPAPAAEQIAEPPSGPRRLSPSSGKSVPVLRATVPEVADWIKSEYTKDNYPHTTRVLAHQAVTYFHENKNRHVIRRTVVEAVARLGWTRPQGRA